MVLTWTAGSPQPDGKTMQKRASASKTDLGRIAWDLMVTIETTNNPLK